MKNALLALLTAALPIAALTAQSPAPTATPLPPVTPSPSASAVMVHPVSTACSVVFESAGSPTTSGGPSALHERRYSLVSYAIKEGVGGSRYVSALGLPGMATDMNEAVSSKLVFLKITFTCPSSSFSVANAAVASAAPSGSNESFTVRLPGERPAPHTPTPVNPHPM